MARCRLLACLLLSIAAAGCAVLDKRADDDIARCQRAFEQVDAQVTAAAVEDGRAARVAGHPHLRTDRFLASFGDEPLAPQAYREWLRALRGLDDEARAYELANLPAATRARIDARDLQDCGDLLLLNDERSDEFQQQRAELVRVPDDYDTWKRVVGLYALTRVPFAYGVARYQAGVQAVFDTPVEQLPRLGTLVRYVPPAAQPLSDEGVATILREARSNALGVPWLSGTTLLRLASLYAPVMVVDEVDHNDRIGAPTLDASGTADVDAGRPIVYVRAAYARYHERVLPQMVYSMWFPARPRTSAFDMLGGRLDGITWRVTLDERGRPLAFDAMHNCGCYHMFFPTARARLRALPDTLDETAFVPQRLPELAAGDRIALRIATRTHYVERIEMASPQPGERSYVFEDDNVLRSLPLDEARRKSLFAADGIVPGSERRERYVFWPMGVREPGAMRQWGRHATAFVGRRHFDDPDLFERYFELDQP